jgi:hypothetical protein
VPRRRLEGWNGRLVDRWDIRKERRALERGDAERAQRAGLDMREHRRHRREAHLHMPGHDILQRRSGAAIRHMHDVDLALRLEQFAGEMRRRAVAAGREADLARIGLGVRDQLGERVRGH